MEKESEAVNRSRTAMFIGHRECHSLSLQDIQIAVGVLADSGYDTFLNGGMGAFDRLCAHAVRQIQATHSTLRLYLVIPYLSFRIDERALFDEVIYPEGMERYHFKAAIPARNRYMIAHSSAAICFVNHPWGGAAQSYRLAQKAGLNLIDAQKPCEFLSDPHGFGGN